MKIPVVFKEQACTVSMTGKTVIIDCDDRTGAEELFEFLIDLVNEDA